jgi:hypothetical protein
VARRTNYGFQKQQRDLKAQKKREEKDEKKRRKQEAAEGEVALPADTEHDDKA